MDFCSLYVIFLFFLYNWLLYFILFFWDRILQSPGWHQTYSESEAYTSHTCFWGRVSQSPGWPQTTCRWGWIYFDFALTDHVPRLQDLSPNLELSNAALSFLQSPQQRGYGKAPLYPALKCTLGISNDRPTEWQHVACWAISLAELFLWQEQL